MQVQVSPVDPAQESYRGDPTDTPGVPDMMKDKALCSLPVMPLGVS